MKRWLKALLAAGVTIITLVLWTLVGTNQLQRFFWIHWNVGGPLSQAGGPRPDSYDQSAILFYMIAIGAILLAAGASVCLLMLLPPSQFRNRAWIYLIFMAILLPASGYNYGQKDHIFPAYAQVILNIFLIFLAATTALWIAGFKPNAPDVRVLKHLSLVLLLLGGVFVPAFFSLIWLLWAVGLLTEAQTKQIGFAQITGISAVVSCVIAWLNYQREIGKASINDGRIVRPP